MISIVFLLKKPHSVLVYNAEIDLDLYGEHYRERITGSKTDLNLSAGSTYMRVYMVFKCAKQTQISMSPYACWAPGQVPIEPMR